MDPQATKTPQPENPVTGEFMARLRANMAFIEEHATRADVDAPHKTLQGKPEIIKVLDVCIVLYGKLARWLVASKFTTEDRRQYLYTMLLINTENPDKVAWDLLLWRWLHTWAMLELFENKDMSNTTRLAALRCLKERGLAR